MNSRLALMAALLGMIARPAQPKSTPAVIAMATIAASQLKLPSLYFAVWAAYCRGTEDLVYRGYGLRRRWLVVQGEAIMTTATRHGDLQHPDRTQPTAKSRIGLIVALSMAAGLIAAVLLVAMPFIPPRENVLTGVVLLAYALGWALLAALSTRFSDQPQRWAAAPAPIPNELSSRGRRSESLVASAGSHPESRRPTETSNPGWPEPTTVADHLADECRASVDGGHTRPRRL